MAGSLVNTLQLKGKQADLVESVEKKLASARDKLKEFQSHGNRAGNMLAGAGTALVTAGIVSAADVLAGDKMGPVKPGEIVAGVSYILAFAADDGLAHQSLATAGHVALGIAESERFTPVMRNLLGRFASPAVIESHAPAQGANTPHGRNGAHGKQA